MKGRNEADFGHSLTDLMSGLAVMFLLIAAIFMVQSAQATARAKEALKAQAKLAKDRKSSADKLASLQARDATSIERLKLLRSTLQANPQLSGKIDIGYSPDIDPLLLTISFTNEKLQFRPNECEVSSVQLTDLRATLAVMLPEVCETIADPTGQVTQSITLEGHTDLTWPLGANCGMAMNIGCSATSASGECQRQAFENNVRLSASRAQYIFFQARDVLLDDPKLGACLDKNFVVSGRGSMSPIDSSDRRSAKNRRVEIKVRVMAGRP